MKQKVQHKEIKTPENDYLFKKEWTETCAKINKLIGKGVIKPKKKGVIHVPNRALKGGALCRNH